MSLEVIIIALLVVIVILSIREIVGKKLPRYKILRNEKLVLSDRSAAVEMFHKPSQEAIENLFYVDVLIWNKGGVRITQRDVRDQAALVVELKDDAAKILSASVVEATTAENQIEVEALLEDGHPTNKALLRFSFLDRNDGARLAVAYTSRQVSELHLTGSIEGAPEGFREIENPRSRGLGYLMVGAFGMMSLQLGRAFPDGFFRNDSIWLLLLVMAIGIFEDWWQTHRKRRKGLAYHFTHHGAKR